MPLEALLVASQLCAAFRRLAAAAPRVVAALRLCDPPWRWRRGDLLSPKWGAVLYISGRAVDDAAAEVLAAACAAGALPRLTVLHLQRQPLGNAGVAALADAAGAGGALRHLECVSLGNGAFGDAGLRALAAAVAACRLPALRRLDLSVPSNAHPDGALRFGAEARALAREACDARGVELHMP